MSKLKLTLFALVGLATSLTAATEAYADDPISYCHWYARTAISQAHAARGSDRCFHFVNDEPNRWTLDWSAHYQWCLSVFGSGQNASEHQARVAELNECVNQ